MATNAISAKREIVLLPPNTQIFGSITPHQIPAHIANFWGAATYDCFELALNGIEYAGTGISGTATAGILGAIAG